MAIEIENVYGATRDEVESKKFNISIGISPGNRYFTKQRIQEYITWSLKHTKDDILVFIVDELEQINYQVLKGYEEEKAKRIAMTRGEDFVNLVQKIISALQEMDQKRVVIARWSDIRKDDDYQRSRRLIHDEFRENPTFKEAILKIVKETLGERTPKEKAKAEQLANVVSYDSIIMRTNFTRFCDLVSFSAALHQFQRERDMKGFVLAEGKDYEIAREAILKITDNKRSIPLTRKQKMILEEFEKLERMAYSVKEVTKHMQFLSERQLYRELDKLVGIGFLKRSVDIRYSSVSEGGEPCGTKREVTIYELVEFERFELPSWEELQKSVKDDNQDNGVNEE